MALFQVLACGGAAGWPKGRSVALFQVGELLPIGSMVLVYMLIGGILMVNVTIYSSTMDPMGYNLPR